MCPQEQTSRKKVCIRCGGKLPKRNEWYCSRKCTRKSRRECPQCGIKFVRHDPRLKYDDSFCSYRCSVGMRKERDRTAIAKATVHTRQIRRSINSCLLVLGAPILEVYGAVAWHRTHKVKRHNPIGSPQETIYERYTGSELLYWAGNLYKDAAVKWHPDKHAGEEIFYTAKFAEVTEAYRQAIRILSSRLRAGLR